MRWLRQEVDGVAAIARANRAKDGAVSIDRDAVPVAVDIVSDDICMATRNADVIDRHYPFSQILKSRLLATGEPTPATWNCGKVPP